MATGKALQKQIVKDMEDLIESLVTSERLAKALSGQTIVSSFALGKVLEKMRVDFEYNLKMLDTIRHHLIPQGFPFYDPKG